MGYSHMEYVDICLKKQQDVWIISGIVKNKGNIDDTAVLQCYRKVLSGELVPRERELVAFSRIKVEKEEVIRHLKSLWMRINSGILMRVVQKDL